MAKLLFFNRHCKENEERKPTWRSVSAKPGSDTGLAPRIQEELLQVSNRTNNQLKNKTHKTRHRIETDTSSKKICKWSTGIWKAAQCHREMQTKTSTVRYQYTPILFKERTKRTQNNRDSYNPGEDAKWYSHFGKSFASFLQSKQITIRPSKSMTRCLPNGNESTVHTKPYT